MVHTKWLNPTLVKTKVSSVLPTLVKIIRPDRPKGSSAAEKNIRPLCEKNVVCIVLSKWDRIFKPYHCQILWKRWIFQYLQKGKVKATKLSLHSALFGKSGPNSEVDLLLLTFLPGIIWVIRPNHRVGRVLSFFSSRRNWDSPNP